MVNLGPSSACQTCKRRRVKCDQSKPSCKRCAKGGIDCAGYEKARVDIRIKDQTRAVTQRGQRKAAAAASSYRNTRKHHATGLIPSISEDQENAALCFFVYNFATTGRDFNSSRGFFECIVPSLAEVSSDSAVGLSTSAVAIAIYNKWRRETTDELHQKRFNQALTRLRDDLQDPNRSRTTDTLLATLLLQFLENLSAVTRLEKAQRIHQEGALALIEHQGLRSFRSDIAKHLLLYVGHVEVSSAIREHRRVPDEVDVWWEAVDMPHTPGSELDRIGIQVAATQCDFEQMMMHQCDCTDLSCTNAQSLVEVTNQALATERHLVAWSASVPDWWHPLKLASLRPGQAPVPTYFGMCEIYPSIQIASIWNHYRSYRLIILKLLITSSKTFSEDINYLKLQRMQTCVQDLVDSIVYSVPFYLGNRTKPSTTYDMADGSLELPGYHRISPWERPGPIKNSMIMSRDEHVRHAVAQ